MAINSVTTISNLENAITPTVPIAKYYLPSPNRLVGNQNQIKDPRPQKPSSKDSKLHKSELYTSWH